MKLDASYSQEQKPIRKYAEEIVDELTYGYCQLDTFHTKQKLGNKRDERTYDLYSETESEISEAESGPMVIRRGKRRVKCRVRMNPFVYSEEEPIITTPVKPTPLKHRSRQVSHPPNENVYADVEYPKCRTESILSSSNKSEASVLGNSVSTGYIMKKREVRWEEKRDGFWQPPKNVHRIQKQSQLNGRISINRREVEKRDQGK